MTTTTAEPAKQVTDAIMTLAREYALEEVKNSRWYRSAPAKFRTSDPEIVITGIEYHDVHVSVGMLSSDKYQAPFICGETVVGGIKGVFRFQLRFGQSGFVIDEV